MESIKNLRNTIDRDRCLVEENFSIETNRHYESLFALGTGYITTRASIDEGFADDRQNLEYDRIPGNVTLEIIPSSKSKWGTYMPVIGARHPLWRTGIVNLPYYLGLEILADGEKLDLERSDVSDHIRWLDMKTATLYRTMTWRTGFGKIIEIQFKRFMSPEFKFSCVQECGLKAVLGSPDITVISFVDNDVRTNGFEVFTHTDVGIEKLAGPGADTEVLFSDILTNNDTRIVTASALLCGDYVNREVVTYTRRISEKIEFHLEEGEERQITKISAVAADAYFDKDDLVSQAAGIIREIAKLGNQAVYETHKAHWKEKWDISDVEIDAHDDEGYNSQSAIRQAVYHLLRAKADDEDRGLICPKGLTSEVYTGAVFWDMEIFIEPFYIYTNPKAAATVHQFRYKNLPAARELAKKAGYPGARYPWMSAFDGTEACPLWEYADHQVHITTDVIIGMWHYVCNTDDKEFLFNCGAEMLFETARYWTGRVDRVESRPGYQLYGVMGPDEYKPLSNNNAYTNHCVKFCLNLAVSVYDLMKREAPEKLDLLRRRLDLAAGELHVFKDIAEGLAVAKDEESGLIWQCDDFDTKYADVDIEGIWKDRTKLFGHYVLQEKRYRSKIMKQSDVTVLTGIFPRDFTVREKEASFDYYNRYNTHDSSNSMCHQLIAAAAIGRKAAVYDAWKKSIDIDFGKLPRSSDGIHCANVGGMWQEIVFGFAGIESAMVAEALSIDPCIPDNFDRIAFKLIWKGSLMGITLTRTSAEINNASERDVAVRIYGTVHTVKSGEIHIVYRN